MKLARSITSWGEFALTSVLRPAGWGSSLGSPQTSHVTSKKVLSFSVLKFSH